MEPRGEGTGEPRGETRGEGFLLIFIVILILYYNIQSYSNHIIFFIFIRFTNKGIIITRENKV